MLSGFNTTFANLLLQVIAIVILIVAVSQVRKDPVRKHCRLVSVAIIIQLVSVLLIMFPSMSTLADMGIGSSLQARVYLHHLAGLVVIIFSAYIKLAVDGRVRHIVDPFRLMKVVLVLWALVFMGGLALYLQLWEGIVLI